MSSEGQRPHAIRRVLVALDARPESLAALGRASELAGELGAELCALFVEDDNLMRLCGLPVREVTRSGRVRQPDALTVAREIRVRADVARIALERAAASERVSGSFRIARGLVHEALLGAAGASDLITAATLREGIAAPDRTALGAPAVAVAYLGGPTSVRALELAVRLARTHAAGRLHVLLSPGPSADSGALRADLEQRLSGAAVDSQLTLVAPGREALFEHLCQAPAALVVLPVRRRVLEAGALAGLRRRLSCDLFIMLEDGFEPSA